MKRAQRAALFFSSLSLLGLCGCGGSTAISTFTAVQAQANAVLVLSGTDNGTVSSLPVSLASGALQAATNLAALSPPAPDTDVDAVVLSPDRLTLFVADFSVPPEVGTITPFSVDSQTGALTSQPQNSFSGFTGAPQAMISDPSGQFLFVAQEDGTVQVVDVAEGDVVGLQANDSQGGLGQVTLTGEGKGLVVTTVGSQEILTVGNASSTQNMQTFVVAADGTLSANPIASATVGSGNTGVAGVATYTAGGQTFVVAVGDTSTSGTAVVQSFVLNSDGTLTAGSSQSITTPTGLRSVVIEPTAGAANPQTAFVVSRDNGTDNLFALPVDSAGTLQSGQATGEVVAGTPTSVFPGVADLFFVTSDAGVTPVVVNAGSSQATLGSTTATDTGGSLSGVLLQTQPSGP